MDTLHKVLWIKLLEEMFLGMPSEYPWGDEMMLFLNVFNGALLLHPEDSSLLRQYTATAINTAVHFNHLFSLSGYQWILPTMLQVKIHTGGEVNSLKLKQKNRMNADAELGPVISTTFIDLLDVNVQDM